MLKLWCICLNSVEGKWLAKRSGYKLNDEDNGDSECRWYRHEKHARAAFYFW